MFIYFHAFFGSVAGRKLGFAIKSFYDLSWGPSGTIKALELKFVGLIVCSSGDSILI